jgi:hypothetical protein
LKWEPTPTAGIRHWHDDPLYEYVYQQDMGGPDEDQFAANLYGIRMEIGQNPALRFSAGITSTILTAEPGSPHSLFFSASYDAGGWDVSASYDFPAEGLDLGLARFIPAEHEALTLDISSDRFVAGFSGLVTFEDLLGEDFAIHVEELELGVEGFKAHRRWCLASDRP